MKMPENVDEEIYSDGINTPLVVILFMLIACIVGSVFVADSDRKEREQRERQSTTAPVETSAK